MLKKLLNNPYFNAISNLRQILDLDQRKRSMLLLLLLVVNAILEIISIFSIYPITIAAANPEKLNSHLAFLWIKDKLDIQDENLKLLFYLSLFCLFIFLIKTFFGLFTNYIQTRFSLNISKRLSKKVFHKYYEKGHLYINSVDSGKKNYDLIYVPYFFSVSYLIEVLNMTTEIIVLFLLFSAILAIQPTSLLILISLIVPIFLIVYLFTKNKTKILGERRNIEFPKLMATVLESMNAYNDVVLSNKESHYLKILDDNLDSIVKIDAMQIGVYQKISQKLNDLVMGLGLAIIFGYAYYFNKSESDAIAIIGIFAISALRFLPSVNRIMAALMHLKAYSYTANELIGINNTKFSEFKTVDAMPVKSNIRFEDVSFKYETSNINVVDNINLNFEKGQTIGIIGSSGSGKTTLLNILLGFLDQTNGNLLVDNTIINKDNLASFQKSIGYVEQNVYIKNGTLAENVAFGETAEDIDYNRLNFAIEQAMLSDFVKSKDEGFDVILGEAGSNLSGGQRQRVGIARALYKKSEVLIFDEATSALDHETEYAITSTIKNLTKLDKIIIMVAHRYTTLKMCDIIYKLEAGKIVEEMSYEKLLDNMENSQRIK